MVNRPPTPDHTKVLVLGAGSIGLRHLRVVRHLWPQAACAVWVHSPERPPTGDQLAGVSVLSTWSEIEAFAPNFAVVCTPAPTHAQWAARLVGLGCNVLVEKPLDSDLGRAAELQGVEAGQGRCVRVGYNLRHSPLLGRLRQLVQTQALGRVLSVRCEVGQDLRTWRAGRDYRESVSARAALGGGVLNELSHEIDYLHWLFGVPLWVQAHLGHHSALEVDVEDQALLWLAYPSASGPMPLVASVALDFFRQDPTRTCTVVCERGTYRLDLMSKLLQQRLSGQDRWADLMTASSDADASYVAQWQAFDAATQGEPSDCCTLEEAVGVMQTIALGRLSNEQDGARMTLARLTRGVA